jgi:hypothetical protein
VGVGEVEAGAKAEKDSGTLTTVKAVGQEGCSGQGAQLMQGLRGRNTGAKEQRNPGGPKALGRAALPVEHLWLALDLPFLSECSWSQF